MKKPQFSVFEITFMFITSVALGVAYWGWTFVYEMAKPLLKILGLNYLVAGFWIFGSLLTPMIIRKPFVAIIVSMIAAGVEGVLTHWGPMAIVWGLVQGLGVEVILFIYKYKPLNKITLAFAALLSCTFSYALDYFIYNYSSLASYLQITQYISYMISSLVFGAGLSLIIFNKLNEAKVLKRFQS